MRHLVVLTIAIMLVSGCSHLKKNEKKPIVLKEVTVVKPDLKPLPEPPKKSAHHPDQLVKIEEFVPVEKSKNSVQAVSKAEKDAREVASDEKFINAITEYIYEEGRVYKIYCAPGRTTDIILGPGEDFTIDMIGDGDTLDKRWKIPKITHSGTGPNRRTHLFMRPTKTGLEKNMIIPTNKRVYYLEFKSYKHTYQTAIRWLYPQEEYQKRLAEVRLKKQKKASEIKLTGLNVDKMNLSYEIVGDAPWKPIGVFDCDGKTYIKFPASITSSELPLLFLESKNKKTVLVNSRFLADTYIVDRLFDVAVLKIGNEKDNLIRIYNKQSKRYLQRDQYAKRYEHAR